ncbi:TetR/AcrR family transcriptional regulator [Leifsonia shinshuensis]|uniref:AcrR family transcriptional regulator n=1 Tax=Leifsonia shinshuensis TaxID=150026 RepID=A0A853D3D0_9MICO|nr:TetR family transcriptional regulator C-terminal domain-containing protein [Leifsonia shinshuensis]NYJ25205.1 AcrR family transcriptional regulator [Leifsonia shinshuensis]
MPRLIDHDERNDAIAQAAIRVLTRDGLAALSVRNLAAEAGIATASLRRAFPTQDALRQFCFDEIRDAVAARIGALSGEGAPLVLALLLELLPLDATRRSEFVAQLQLGSLALTDPALRPSAIRLSEDVRRACTAAVAELARCGLLSEANDAGLEAERLHALLDGLALHLLWEPGPDPAGRASRILTRHIDSLAG